MSKFGVFSFGAPTSQTSTGLTFGTPATQAAPATSSFSFGSATSAAPAGQTSGFSFGGAAPSASPAFSFGGAAPSAGLGSVPSASAFGGFGGAAAGAPATGSLFGTTAVAPQTQAVTAMPFGGQPTVSPFSQGMGTAVSTAPTGFTGFGMQAAAPTAAATAPTSGFPFAGSTLGSTGGFGGLSQFSAAPAATTTFGSFGTISTPATTSLAPGAMLGGGMAGQAPAASAAATTASTFGAGFTFGAPANASPFGSGATGAARPPTFATVAPTTAPTSNLVGFGFGGVTSTTAAATPVQPAAFGSKLSQMLAPAATSSFSSAPTSTPSAFGSTTVPQAGVGLQMGVSSTTTGTPSGFGLTTTTATPSGFGLTAPTTAATSFSMPTAQGFGQKPTETVGPAPTTAAAVGAQPIAPAATTAATTGFSFGGLPKTTAGGFTLGTTTATLPGLLSTTAATTTAPPTLTSTTSVVTTTQAPLTAASISANAPSAPPSITFRKLEETINKWSQELEEQERVFLTQATQVNAWDRILIADGEKITQLNESMSNVQLDQERLDQELDFIKSQQRELDELLIPLEKSVESMPNLSIHQHADLEREQTFHMAENIDGQLRHMSRDLKDIIAIINATSGNSECSDPIQQIGKILNAHMDSLQWIDQNSRLLQNKIDDVSRLYEQRRLDHESGIKLPSHKYK